MGRKKVVRPEDESGNGDASLPRPKRAKQPTAKPPRNKRKVSAGRGKNSFRKAADDLYLPNVDVELVPVTEQLFTHPGDRRFMDDVHPPRPKDYFSNQGEVFGKRFECPSESWDADFRDPRFGTIFQLDYYDSVILSKSQPVVLQKYIDWDHCVKLGDPEMTRALEMLERRNFKNLMTMQYPWSNEVIAQFFATVWYEKATADHYGYMHFSIEGQPYYVSYARFGKILGFEFDDIDKHRLNCNPHHDIDLSFAYNEDATADDFYTANNMRKVYRYFNLLVRQTLVPKIGGASVILSSMGPFLKAFQEGNEEDFSAFGFIYRQIQLTSWDPKKSCTHAPYIMKMIEVVTQKEFIKEVSHEPYRPVRISETAKRRGRKPSQPRPQSVPLPSSCATAAAYPEDVQGLLLQGMRSVFGMSMAIYEANREHHRFVQEELHRAEVQRKMIAEHVGVTLSLVCPLPPAPQQPEWWNPLFQQSFVQPQQTQFDTDEQP